jgi:serine/threonine protein kinase
VIPAAGTIVAERFRLTRPLGQGGMGSVWLAQHIGLDVPCAIKFIHASNVSDDVRLRFEREARVAAQIRSPHVVQILDHGVWEGAPYIAMEYLEGEDLDDRIRRLGQLDARETLIITAQVARALTRAHVAGLVHRDLKPANIFLVRDDDREIAKVLDFGIAKDSTPRVESTTKTGSLLGTPAYMSPEQAQGTKNVDHRSDLWSLAVVVFECITGKLPFESEAFGDLLLKIMIKPLPVPSRFAPVPSGFDAWWARAASRDPDARFQSAKELADALLVALDISMPDSFDSRASISGMFRAPGERASSPGRPSSPGRLSSSSREIPLFVEGPASAPPSFAAAVTLVASDAEAERASLRGAAPASSPYAEAAPALPPRVRPQTAGVLVSVVSPPPRRPGLGAPRLLAAAAAGVVLVGLAGFFLLRSKGPVDDRASGAHPGPAGSAVVPAPALPEGPALAPSPVEPSAAASARSSDAPPDAHAAPAGSVRAAPTALPAVTGSFRPRQPAPADTVRRKPKPKDFGI